MTKLFSNESRLDALRRIASLSKDPICITLETYRRCEESSSERATTAEVMPFWLVSPVVTPDKLEYHSKQLEHLREVLRICYGDIGDKDPRTAILNEFYSGKYPLRIFNDFDDLKRELRSSDLERIADRLIFGHPNWATGVNVYSNDRLILPDKALWKGPIFFSETDHGVFANYCMLQ